VRLFLAVGPSDAARAQLGDVLNRARDHVEEVADAMRWTEIENIHLTLHFLGEVGDERAAALQQALGDRLPVRAFSMTTGALGTFPERGPARVVWLSVTEGVEPLLRVHEELARRLAAGAFAAEDRALAAHLTLARVRNRERHRTRQLGRLVRDVRCDPITWRVDRVTLFRSHPSSSAPRYEPVQHIGLER
jgi:2'-5' RNA ligase